MSAFSFCPCETPPPTLCNEFDVSHLRYIWSSVLVSSAVSVFQKAGAPSAPSDADGVSLVHGAAGRSFLEHVLSKGNSIDVLEGFVSFGEFLPM